MRKPVLTKTEAVRQVLTAAARPLKIEQLHLGVERKLKQVIGRANLYTLLSTMQNKGEIESMGRGENRFYNLTRKGRRA